MDCERIKTLLDAYIDGELTEKEDFFVREHLVVCSDCCQEEDLLRKASDLLKSWENFPAPDGFCEALLAKAESISRQPRRFAQAFSKLRPLAGPRMFIRVAFCGAAILLLGLGIMFFVRSPLKRTPMVNPLPTHAKSALYGTDGAASFESLPRYTTMAEMKVSGIWNSEDQKLY